MLRDQFLKTIRKFRMIEKGETIFVGVSGGADSATLLYLLNEIKSSWKLKLGVIHVNHGLRGKASQQDELFVKKLARRFEIPVFTAHVPVKQKAKKEALSLEEAARELRYRAFEKIAGSKHIKKIALAHSEDDQAETVLMRILLGTGLQGLQAIRPKLARNGIYFIRPLIEISRAQIRAFARVNSISYREDRSNQSKRFVRNRIRLKLIPELERSFNPQVKKALARLPHLLDFDLSFLEETAGRFYKRLAHDGKDEISFPKKSFLKLSPSIQYRLLGRAARALGGASIDFEHWNEFLNHLSTERNFTLQFPKKLFVVVTPEAVRIKKAKKAPLCFSHPLSLNKPLHIPEIGATLSCQVLSGRPKTVRKEDKSFEWFDLNKLSFPLTVRSRKPGDRFQPLGQVKPVKLKRFLINKKIPAEDRGRLPLVVSKNKIAWAAGVALGESFKVTSRTKRLLRISMQAENLT